MGLTSGIDVAQARRDTPGCSHVAHLNNAGAALPPAQVTDAVIEHLRREADMGGYEAAEAAAGRVEHTYDAIASMIGADRDEIATVENATRAWDMAFYALRFQPGDRILTTRAEYASNVIALLQVARRTGAVVEVVDDDHTGQVSVADLRHRLDDGRGPVRLVALTHVPTQGGLVNPVAEIGAAPGRPGWCSCSTPVSRSASSRSTWVRSGATCCRRPGASTCAAREALGSSTPDGPDRPARAPVPRPARGHLDRPRQYEIRADARRFENWETNYAAKIGLGVAVDYALSWGLEAIEARVTALASDLRSQLGELPGVGVHDQGARRCGIVTFTVEGDTAQHVQQRLREHGVNVSVSLVDYARLDLEARRLPDLVRASVHYYNTQEELDRLVSVVARTSAG